MKPWFAIIRLLVIVAIMLAPFAAPAVAGPMAMPMAMKHTATDMASFDDTAMAEMPCCPPEKPVVPDCQKACPLAAFCLAQIVNGILPVHAVSVRLGVAVALRPASDATPSTLAPLPPPRPPQV